MNRAGQLTGILAAIIISAWVAPHALAASSPTTGTIDGTIFDEARKPIPNADVVLVNVETGFLQELKSDEAGGYAARFLPLGMYSITASLSGYGSVVREGIKLRIGQHLTVSLTLDLMTVSEKVTVRAEAPIVEVRTTQIKSTVNEKAIETLPLNGRNFTDHVQLTPGALAHPAYDRINVGGQRAINNNIMMDGVDNNSAFFGEQRGGTRPPYTFSQEAVKEFEVINNGFSAEFGRAGGAMINAVTKSGTNKFKGSAFLFYKDESMVEDDANGNPEDNFEQEQFGLTLGGPVIRDKTFFFLSYDQQLLDRPIFSSLNMQDFYWTMAGNNGEAPDDFQDYQNSYGFTLPDGDIFTINRGEYIQTQNQSSFLLKGDWQINAIHRFTLRDSLNLYDSENGTAGSGERSYNGMEESISNSLALQLTSLIGGNLFNEVRFQYAYEDRPRGSNDTRVPETSITGFGTFGQRNYLPNGLEEKRFQLIENLTWVTDTHEVKGGLDLNFLSIVDDFFRTQGGAYSFDSLEDFWDHYYNPDPTDSNQRYDYSQGFDRTGNQGVIEYDTADHSLYVLDSWKAKSNLTVNYGLRYEYQVHPDPNPPSYSDWVDDLPAGEVYNSTTGENLSRTLYDKMTKIDEDTDNIAPRLGIAWAPGVDGKTVVRTGAGIFYSRTPSLLVANALLNNGYEVAQYDFTGSNRPTWPNRIPEEPQGSASTPNVYVFAPDFENPETYRFNVGLEREVLPNISLGLDYIHAYTRHLERPTDLNLLPSETLSDEGRPMYRTSRRPDPNFGKIIEFRSDAESRYNAMTVKMSKRFTETRIMGKEIGYQLMGSYTYSVNEDNNSNERSVGTYFGYPDDPANLEAEWGFADFDVRHRAVLSGTAELPWGVGLSAIMQYQSGRPWTTTTGSDTNSDNFGGDRPMFTERNSYRHPHFEKVDLRLSWSPTFIPSPYELEILAEAFNVFNAANRYVYYSEMVWGREDFGEAFGANDPRQYQVGIKFRY